MTFEDITLLAGEEKLLREMTDGTARDSRTPSITGLHGYGLVEMSHDYSQGQYQMLFTINEYGKRYLLYLDKRESIKANEKATSKEMMRLTKQGVAVSKIAAIASVISAILAALAIFVTVLKK